MSEPKIIPLNQPEQTTPPPIILSAEEQKRKAAEYNKQNEKDNKEFAAQSKEYYQLLDKYIELYVSALEKGEDISARLKTAWKMRCSMTMKKRSMIVPNPLDFEKALDKIHSIANGVPSLADAVVSYEQKIGAIASLLHQFSDKEHVLWRNINEVLFPTPKPVAPNKPQPKTESETHDDEPGVA